VGGGGAAMKAAPRLIAALALLAGAAAQAETSAEARARAPELFDPATGLRITRYRAPTPQDIPGALALDADAVRAAAAAGAALIDVASAGAGVYFEEDGAWVGSEDHATIPGAIWLPEVGRGALSPEIEAYFRAALARITGGDMTRRLVFFCIADCWMSWNAAQRAASWGYPASDWFPLGVDGWAESGGARVPASPMAVAPGG